jgi:hypothetical protein
LRNSWPYSPTVYVDHGMTNLRVVSRSLGWALAAGFGLSACSELSINERMFQRGPDGFRASGQACYPLEDGSSSAAGGGGGDFSYEATAENGVLTVEVRTDASPPIRRQYDRAFARSGMRDEFTVMTAAGQQYLFRYWGSNPCDSSHPLGSAP